MKIKTLNSGYKILNLGMLIIATITLNYSTIFWIGSEEQYIELKNKSFLLLFINRFILNAIVIFLILFLFFLISRIIGKKKRKEITIKKIILFDTLILSMISTFMIIIKNI